MRAVLAVLVLGLAAACAREYRSFEPPPLDFRDRAPIRLAVDRVDVESAYEPKGEPFVEHTLVLTPEAAARQLLEQRLRAVGGPGSLEAVVLDASVEHEALETEEGIRGWFTTEAAARLRGDLRVRVERLDEQGNAVGSVTTAVTRSREIPEDTPYARRQELAYELVRDLTDDLDAGLVANMEENFASIVRP